MAKNINYVSHKKSKVKINGKPQLPSADSLVEGEIAVNFAENVETLSIKNESGTVVTFSSDNYYSEQKLGSAFTGANSAVTVTDEFGLYVKKTDVDQVIDETTSASTNPIATKVVAENELIVSNALTDLDERKLDASAYTPTDLSNYYTKSETSGATEIANALSGKSNTGHTHDDRYYTESELTGSSTTVVVAKANSASTVPLAGVTNADDLKAIEALSGNNGLLKKTAANTWTLDTNTYSTTASAVTSGVYNSTNQKIELKNAGGTVVSSIDATDFIKDGMISGVTLESKSGTTYLVINWNTDAGIQTTELNIGDIFEADNYYTKSETSGKTEIQNALTAKTDTATTTALNNVVTAHTANTTVHITAAERTSWNAVTAKTDNSAFTAHTASTVHMTTTEKRNLDSLATNIAAISGITSAKVGNWDTAYTNSHTHSNKTALDSITGSVGTMAYQATSSYSSATQVNTALVGKTDTGTTTALNNVVTSHTSNTNIHVTTDDKTTWNTVTAKTDNSEFTAHTANTTAHITAAERTSWNNAASGVTDLSGQSQTIAAAINDLHDNKLDITAYTPTDLSNYYTKSETSGKTEIANALSGKANVDDVEEMEETLVASITDIESRMAEKTALSALADEVNEVKDEVDDKLDITAYTPTTLLEKITYSALKSKRDNGQLVQGQWYRITDYTCTTTQENTQSAGHVFDIIVRADANNVLNENARAIKHSGDTYFSASTLEAWELKYSLDNDTNRFAWADSTNNGKGVIYYMKDEFANECSYDFKNIMFERWRATAITTSSTAVTSEMVESLEAIFVDHYHSYQSSDMNICNGKATVVIDSSDSRFFYTFSLCTNDFKTFESDDNSTVVDGSLKGYGDNMYTSNVIGELIPFDEGYSYKLNNIVFKPIGQSADDCGNNVFGKGCYDITLGFSWTVNNTFGNSCNSNTFGNSCYSNTFGNECYHNSFGNGCNSNTFGNECGGNTFGNSCYRNTFGNSCQHIAFSKDYCYYNIVENGNQYITLTSTQTTSGNNLLRNITITQGVNNTSTLKTISHNTVNDTFKTTYQNSSSKAVNI